MHIEIFHSRACASLGKLRQNLDRALSVTGVSAEVSFREVDEAEAASMSLSGSPTVLIDGRDIAPGGQPGIA